MLALFIHSTSFQRTHTTSYLSSKPPSFESYQSRIIVFGCLALRYIDRATVSGSFSHSPIHQHPYISDFIDPGHGELALQFAMGLRSSIGQDAAAGGSEDMFHYPWDSLLRATLAVIGRSIGTELPLEMDRNGPDGYVLHYLSVME